MTNMQVASSLGAKTVRACDSCIRRRAQWFCAADDAFLCHGCDTLVHSANELASRHERVRLQTASSKVTTWHSGFTRKARTPRHNTNNKLQNRLKDQVLFNNACVLPLVPELGGEESLVVDNDEAEEQLLCRVPVFDAEPCNVYDMKNDDLDSFSDMDFALFAADVESLLGSTDSGEVLNDESVMVKVKSEEEEEEIDDDIACHVESVLDMTKEDAFRWNSIDSVLSGAREENNKEEGVVVESNGVCVREEAAGTKRDIFLRLNYDEVINAWASQGSSPWTTPNPPKFNNDYDLSLGSSGGDWEVRTLWGKLDGGREARVSRYREKRRTRLFAKKIRYEVRKLNAEKRPRMKGRFVKRTCFVGATASPPYH